MPDFETLHGDEEAIETCSMRFYELLDPHFSISTGVVDLRTPAEEIEKTREYLLAEGYGHTDIELAFTDAMQTLNAKKQIMDYL